MAENNRPVHQVRIGRIKAAVFENGDDAPRKVQFPALYKERESWRGSGSIAREALPLLIKVVDQVHSYLHEKNGESEQNGFSDAF